MRGWELGGLEFLGGVPGSVGGGLIMNAGTYLGEFKDVTTEVVSVRLRDGEVVRRDRSGCGFRYRGSDLPGDEVVIEGWLALRARPRGEIEAAVRELRDRRREREPQQVSNAGSVFKNPPSDYAGRLIEATGLKGTRVGGAECSPVHANWFVNLGGATAADMLELIRVARERVIEVHGCGSSWNGRSSAMIDAWKNRRIGVLMGGLSSEREVSLDSGAGVLAALRERGHQAVRIDWTEGVSLAGELAEQDVAVVWNALHGTYGEDGAVQGLLTCLHLPYTGSGILASALAMDKVASKRIFESNGVPTPRWQIVPSDGPASLLDELELPLAIKPALEGSSVGVSIVRERHEVEAALTLARRHRGPTLVEAYIPGAEICFGILAEDVLGSIEIRPATPFYDYEAKYRRDDTEYLVPASLSPEVLGAAEAAALAAHQALGCSGYSRVDLRVSPAGEPFLLEVNTLPGMTSHSLIPKIAAHRGISYADLCERILALAHL